MHFASVVQNALVLERYLRANGDDNLAFPANMVGFDTSRWKSCFRGLRITRLDLVPEAGRLEPTRRASSYEVVVTTMSGGRIAIEMAAWVSADGSMIEPGLVRLDEFTSVLVDLAEKSTIDSIYADFTNSIKRACENQDFWDHAEY